MSSCHITLGRDKLPLTHMSHDNLKGKVNKNHCHESGNQFQIVLEEISGHCVALPGRLGGNLARTPHSPPLCHSWFRSRSSSFLPCTSSFLSFSSFPLPHGRWSLVSFTRSMSYGHGSTPPSSRVVSSELRSAVHGSRCCS
jgi:hypothetical protein